MVNYNLAGKRVFVAGHQGMVGRALVSRLQEENCEVLTAGRGQLDLRDQTAVYEYFRSNKPDVVIVAAARVGGIFANSQYPAAFLFDNLAIATNAIEGAFRAEVEKLLYLGSSCIYPKFAPQPIPEDALLTGALEPTNQWYAIAKIAGLKLCEAYRQQYGVDYISGMPTNLYGPGDNFHPEHSHVIPALIRRAHEAKLNRDASLQIWGTGSPRREFLHVNDCADALVFLIKGYSSDSHINVGSGKDLPIAELARLVMKVVGFEGNLEFDTTKPDGTPRKLMSGDKLRDLGWTPKIELETGLRKTYEWFLSQKEHRAK